MNYQRKIAAASTILIGGIVATMAFPQLARAQDTPVPETSVTTTPEGVKIDDNGVPVEPKEDANAAEFGVGIRLRGVKISQTMLGLFLDRVTPTNFETGIGVDLVRRKGDFELQIGLEYEKISAEKGIWIEKDKPIPANEADFTEFDGFGWVTLEANFINHYAFTKSVALRYGGGAGIGILFGDITHIDRACTNSDPASCTIDTNGGNRLKYDLKSPVYPVITGLLGVQVRPSDKITVNIEGGFRLVLPFLGVSSTYFF
jgi:hypothetical protein